MADWLERDAGPGYPPDVVRSNETTGQTYLTPGELVVRWRSAVTVKTLRNWRSAGRGPDYVTLGTRVLYSLEAVERYEKDQARKLDAGGSRPSTM